MTTVNYHGPRGNEPGGTDAAGAFEAVLDKHLFKNPCGPIAINATREIEAHYEPESNGGFRVNLHGVDAKGYTGQIDRFATARLLDEHLLGGL